MRKLIHPFLFAISPILFLFAYNIDEVSAGDLILPILAAIALVSIILLLLRLASNEYYKNGIIASYFLVLFFSYGHVRDLVSSWKIGGFSISHAFFLGPLWLVLLIVGAVLVIRSRRDFLNLTKTLNIVAVTLVIISLINISIYGITSANLGDNTTGEVENGLSLGDLENPPDIYYIILDGYAGASTLEEIYNYDNSEFIDYLTDSGFYIASNSCSNYALSSLSMASSLNMEYINYLSETVGIESEDTSVPLEMIRNNDIANLLKSIGYSYIYISSGYDIKGMDKYTDKTMQRNSVFGIRMSNFTSCLVQTTALAPFTSFISNDAKNDILYSFDALAGIPDIEEPTFVFAHVFSPHPPFIFDSDGNPVQQDVFKMQGDVWKNKEKYIEQLIFINKKVEILVDEILSKSDTKPIIIIQADHGTASAGQFDTPYDKLTETQMYERMKILNAYYLPENVAGLFYDSVTPVNSFRIIFNYYFGSDYELLADESYFSNYETPYNFVIVPAQSEVYK